MYTLYYAPGACSLSPSIALREAGLPFEQVRVDLKTKQTERGEDYAALNPKGYVPTLRLPGGELISEGVAVVQFIADQVPERHLAPAPGTLERVRLHEWLTFISSELHKGLGPLHGTEANEEYKTFVKEQLGKRLAFVEKHLADRPFLLGKDFTIADSYLFYALRSWQKVGKGQLGEYPVLAGYFRRLADRPSVKAALAAEAAHT